MVGIKTVRKYYTQKPLVYGLKYNTNKADKVMGKKENDALHKHDHFELLLFAFWCVVFGV